MSEGIDMRTLLEDFVAAYEEAAEHPDAHDPFEPLAERYGLSVVELGTVAKLELEERCSREPSDDPEAFARLARFANASETELWRRDPER